MHLASHAFRVPLRLLLALLAALTLAAPSARAAIGDLYVTSDATNITKIFSGTTGNGIAPFTNSFASFGQMAIHFGTSNNRVLIGHNFGGVEEFDASTGAYIKTYNPGGGWMWAGVYAPNGDVLCGDMNTQDVRRYNGATGALISVFFNISDPTDMEFGPNGHLYICSFSVPIVAEVNGVGNLMGIINLPPNSQANDVCYNPATSEFLVSDMRANVVYRFAYPGYAPMGFFSGTGWARPHGIAISPHTGRVMVVDGVTAQVHEFNQFTYAETNPAFLTPPPGLKIVDLAFRPGNPTPVKNTSWGRMKSLYSK